MTWLVLRYWYGYHRAKFQKWDYRKNNILEKQGHKSYRQRRVLRVWAKRDHHAWWFNHYCSLMSAYGHKIDCIHFGEGENTIQANSCPYREDECTVCDGRIHLSEGVWCHYLTYYDDGYTRRNDHTPLPKLAHWPHTLRTKKRITHGT